MDEPRSTAPAPWEWDTLESSGALVCDYILCLHEDHVAVPFFRLRSPTATPLCLLLPRNSGNVLLLLMILMMMMMVLFYVYQIGC